MAMKTGKRIVLAAGTSALVVMILVVWIGWPHLVSWYRFTRAFESLGLNAQDLREYRHRQTGIVMVLLPGGTYWMGAQKKDPNAPNYDPEAQDNEEPVHEVTLGPFMIGKYEVTQAQWKAVMGESDPRYEGEDDKPVTYVSRGAAHRFEAQSGLAMPTEAQWEYACRGGSPTSNHGSTTQPGGPNGFGLEATGGNVGQITKDIYQNDFYYSIGVAAPAP